MDIKQRLREMIDATANGTEFSFGAGVGLLCRDALAEIERLEFNISAIKGAAQSALRQGNMPAGHYTTVLQDIVAANIRDIK